MASPLHHGLLPCLCQESWFLKLFAARPSGWPTLKDEKPPAVGTARWPAGPHAVAHSCPGLQGPRAAELQLGSSSAQSRTGPRGAACERAEAHHSPASRGPECGLQGAFHALRALLHHAMVNIATDHGRSLRRGPGGGGGALPGHQRPRCAPCLIARAPEAIGRPQVLGTGALSGTRPGKPGETPFLKSKHVEKSSTLQ